MPDETQQEVTELSNAISFPQSLKAGGKFALLHAHDVMMKDGKRLDEFNALPPVTEENNGQVLKVIDGAWGVGLTIQAEIDSESSAQLNIF